MLGGTTRISAVLGAAPPADADTVRIRNYVKSLAEAGLSVLMIEPYAKAPIDVRSSPQRRAEDTAAQQAARAAGRADWARMRSLAGVHLASSDPALLAKYVDRYRKFYESDYDDHAPVNLAVAVGPSRLIVVDCDTEEQVAAFLADAQIPPESAIPPTVRSPGQRDAEGNWAHYGGGHFYFTLPEGVELSGNSGSLTMPGGYAVLWNGRYVLIPPSVRAEGTYYLSGQDYPAPQWLIDVISNHTAARDARRASADPASGDLAPNIDAWASERSWADLLEPAGWTLTARPDGCGCEVWTAPGLHASPKSATAHDTGCTYGRYSEVNAPLHIWTDNPGEELETWIREHGSKTVSKLQLVAALYHGGDVGSACADMGLLPKDDLEFGNDILSDLGVSASNLAADPPGGLNDSLVPPMPETSEVSATQLSSSGTESGPWSGFTVPGAVTNDSPLSSGAPPDPPPADPPPFSDPDEPPDDGVLDTGDMFMPRIAWFDYWRDYPAPEFVVEGLIEKGGLAAVIGAPGIGKSAVTLDIINCIVTGQPWRGRRTLAQRVLYLPGEGQSGTGQRIKAWEKARKANVGGDLAMGDSVLRAGAPKEAWQRLIALMLTHRIGALVFDTFARMAVGIEENSATDVGKVVARLDEVRKLTGCTVIVIHHTAKGTPAARGSSALNGALDTEILIEEGNWHDPDNPPPGKPLQARVTKQKNAEQPDDPIFLLMTSFEESVVITGPSGEVGDLIDETEVARAILPEPAMETAVRLAGELAHFTSQGLTISEAAMALRPDEWTAGRADAPRAWRLALRRAVDLGMRFSLFETLSGTPSGARYILSTSTIDAFRTAVIAAGLSD